MVLCYLSLFPALKAQQPSCAYDVTNQYSKDVNIIGCQPWTICFQTFSLVSSVAQSYPTLCDPTDCSMPGFLVHHQLLSLLKLMSIKSVMPSILSSVVPFSSCLQSFAASGSFLMSQLFASGDQSIGASASASVLPMNIQDWFPLGFDCFDLLAVQGTIMWNSNQQNSR